MVQIQIKNVRESYINQSTDNVCVTLFSEDDSRTRRQSSPVLVCDLSPAYIGKLEGDSMLINQHYQHP